MFSRNLALPVAPFSSHSVPTLGQRSRRAERIEEVHAGKVLFVVRNDNAVVRLPDRRNDHVESTPRSPCVRALGHETCQMSAASSSKANTRPRKSAWGPSGPLNHSSSSLRFFPDGFSKMPRYISARLKEQMNRSSSTCLAIHSVSGWDGRGFVALLIMLVSRRYRVID